MCFFFVMWAKLGSALEKRHGCVEVRNLKDDQVMFFGVHPQVIPL